MLADVHLRFCVGVDPDNRKIMLLAAEIHPSISLMMINCVAECQDDDCIVEVYLDT